MDELCKHAVGSAFVDLPEPAENREFIVCHAHVRLKKSKILDTIVKGMTYLICLDVGFRDGLQLCSGYRIKEAACTESEASTM